MSHWTTFSQIRYLKISLWFSEVVASKRGATIRLMLWRSRLRKHSYITVFFLYNLQFKFDLKRNCISVGSLLYCWVCARLRNIRVRKNRHYLGMTSSMKRYCEKKQQYRTWTFTETLWKLRCYFIIDSTSVFKGNAVKNFSTWLSFRKHSQLSDTTKL